MKIYKKLRTEQALRVRIEIVEMLRREMADIPATELLAVFSYTVGQIIALQDQRKITTDMAMMIVRENIHAGNADAIAQSFVGAGHTKN